MLLEGHLRFKETLKKKKKTNTDNKWITFQMTKLDLEALYFSHSLVQNVK